MSRPKGDTYYNKVAKNYDKRRKNQEWWGVEQEEMKSLLETLPKGLSVVDIPFGTGRFLEYYKEREYSVSGLDSSLHMINAARDSNGALMDGVDVKTGDAAELPFKDGSFDLLVSTRFLHDIVTFRHAKTILGEFSRVTKKYAIIQLGESTGEGRMPDDDETMRGALSPAGVDKLLKEHGFVAKDRRFVKENKNEDSKIHHILCEKA